MPKCSSDLSSKIWHEMGFRNVIPYIFGAEPASCLTTPPMFSGCLDTAFGVCFILFYMFLTWRPSWNHSKLSSCVSLNKSCDIFCLPRHRPSIFGSICQRWGWSMERSSGGEVTGRVLKPELWMATTPKSWRNMEHMDTIYTQYISIYYMLN